MRICLVYDHLFPHSAGGAERWMRDLATRLADAGHDVTYLTMRHWPVDSSPALPRIRVLGLVEAGRVYKDDRRSLIPPMRFGIAVAYHLLRHGSSYDVVHTASFPYFPLLAAALLRRLKGYRLVVDWHEIWTRRYWTKYAGAVIGTAGWLVQRTCVRVQHTAHVMSALHERRLVAEGYRGVPVRLPGLYSPSLERNRQAVVDPTLVVFAGRHIREKRVDALVRGFAWARTQHPGLRLEIYGDGPERAQIERLVRELHLEGCVHVCGKRPEADVFEALSRAACVATASEREGYGLVVVEAAAHGTPAVIVAGEENAATELVIDGVNGAVAPTATPPDIGGALLRVIEGGAALRATTERWFVENADRLLIERSLELVLASYGVPRESAPSRTTPETPPAPPVEPLVQGSESPVSETPSRLRGC